MEERGHRAIDVVYHADAERYGNYVPTGGCMHADRATGQRGIWKNPRRVSHRLSESNGAWEREFRSNRRARLLIWRFRAVFLR